MQILALGSIPHLSTATAQTEEVWFLVLTLRLARSSPLLRKDKVGKWNFKLLQMVTISSMLAGRPWTTGPRPDHSAIVLGGVVEWELETPSTYCMNIIGQLIPDELREVFHSSSHKIRGKRKAKGMSGISYASHGGVNGSTMMC